MAKFQKKLNSKRYDQNVDKVLISRKMGLKNSKRPFLVNISLISFFLNFGTQGGSPYWPPIRTGTQRVQQDFTLLCI